MSVDRIPWERKRNKGRPRLCKIDSLNEDLSSFITQTSTKRCSRLDRWLRTMEIIYSYPSPPTGWHQEQNHQYKIVLMIMIMCSSFYHKTFNDTDNTKDDSRIYWCRYYNAQGIESFEIVVCR